MPVSFSGGRIARPVPAPLIRAVIECERELCLRAGDTLCRDV